MSTKSYSICDLYNELQKNDPLKKEGIERALLELQQRLQDTKSLIREPRDEETIQKLSAWISQVILPDSSIKLQSDIPSKNEPSTPAKAIQLNQSTATLGFQCLHLFYKHLSHAGPLQTDANVLLTAAVYSSRDFFTATSLDLASTYLSLYESQASSKEFIIDFLLQSFIRPLFSKSIPSSVTTSGRKAMPSSQPPKKFDFEAEKRDKPWKYEKVYTVTLLEWVVERASHDIITTSWHLFIPPLLTLLDDPSTNIRTRGLRILTVFLPKFPTRLLMQTGLGPVFFAAILPTLLFLPSLTPMSESIILLPAAYAALNALLSARFIERDDPERVKALDQVVRQGILEGWLHCPEMPEIVLVLVEETRRLVEELGVWSVKHLKDLLPMLATVIEDSFTTLKLFSACLDTLKAIILNTWPRISEPVHRMTILRMLVVCWGKEELGANKKQLEEVGRLFFGVVEAADGIIFRADVAKLVAANPTLEQLFGCGDAITI